MPVSDRIHAYRHIEFSSVIKRMYSTTMGDSLPQVHGCKPVDTMFLQPQTEMSTVFLEWLKRDLRGYIKPTYTPSSLNNKSVLEISRQLYQRLPHPEKGLAYFQGQGQTSEERVPLSIYNAEFVGVEQARHEAVGLVADSILHAHSEVCSISY